MEANTNKIKNSLEMKKNMKVEYKGKMFEIVTWEGKPDVRFEAAVRAPGVRLIIETEKDGKKALLMTREIRREADGYDFRLPGGKVFDSLDELENHRKSGANIAQLAQVAAQKEGKEEAGIIGGKYTSLEISKAGASVEWDLHYFLVSGATFGKQELEEYEKGEIETVVLSAEEIFEKLTKREIKEGRSADMLWLGLQKNGFIRFKNLN